MSQIGITNPIGGVVGIPMRISGPPTANVTLLGHAIVGTLLIDDTTGILWSCTATDGVSTIVWTKVGLET